jgi:hypothetical protein
MLAAAVPEAQKMIHAMLMILLAALMHLRAQKLKRQYYNLRRGVLTRADLTSFPGLHSPWAYVRSGMQNMRGAHSRMICSYVVVPTEL